MKRKFKAKKKNVFGEVPTGADVPTNAGIAGSILLPFGGLVNWARFRATHPKKAQTYLILGLATTALYTLGRIGMNASNARKAKEVSSNEKNSIIVKS